MKEFPTFPEIRFQAMREKRFIECQVMLFNDEIATVRFGPRGGHKIIEKN